MNEYEVLLKVTLSALEEIEANSEKEALEKVKEAYLNGKIMGDIWKDEFYNSYKTEIEAVEGNIYSIRVYVTLDTLVGLETYSEERALEKLV